MSPDQGEVVELGELISLLYEAYLEEFGDEELASVAASTVVNEYLAQRSGRPDVISYVN